MRQTVGHTTLANGARELRARSWPRRQDVGWEPLGWLISNRRRRCAGVRERDFIRGRRHLRHCPGGADALNRNAEIGKDACKPDTAKCRKSKRNRDTITIGRSRLGFIWRQPSQQWSG